MSNIQHLEYRMYGLVPYNISPIQQGIQYGHAVVEYLLKYPPFTNTSVEKWACNDKTFIILNGGTTNDEAISDRSIIEYSGKLEYKGSLNTYKADLIDNDINLASFTEPDLGNQLTAVVFLVDERVWNKDKYPDFKFKHPYQIPTHSNVLDLGGESFINTSEDIDYLIELKLSQYAKWRTKIGGEKNEYLRKFLKQFKLA